MNNIYFMFGIHNHQPIGNFDSVFQMAYTDCYLPFIELLLKHPKIKMSLHHTGPLLEWIEKNKPEYFDKIRLLVSRNQVELMGGGFYEPLLPVIPENDALGQIAMMQDYINEKFDVVPKGMWLSERVWEPALPYIIKKAGMQYVTLDDTHFYYAGFKAKDMFGYYITENQGYTTAVFPIDKELRYRIPFRLAEETINYFKEVSGKYPGTGITLADDGEKFGVWPGTHKWAYKDGYLETLFSLLEENADWINMLTFTEYMEKFQPLGKVYLPTASYDEMMEWSLPCESQSEFSVIVHEQKEKNQYNRLRPYIRGGFWRNFLVKYPESNRMYSKMLHVSRKVNKSGNPLALRELYKSQCNCAYWHGLFGGLYLNYLRHALYYHMITAENMIDSGKLEIEEKDYDFDGEKEILVSSPKLNLYISPNSGGQIFELDYKPKQFNITNTLTRRKEAYHHKLEKHNPGTLTDVQPMSIHDMVQVKEEGLENILFYDWYNRNSLIDHILDESTTIQNFSQCRYEEKGDFVNQPYNTEQINNGITQRRQGRAGEYPFFIKKSISLKEPNGIAIEYELKNPNETVQSIWFGVEFNLTLLAGRDAKRFYVVPEKEITGETLDKISSLDEIRELVLLDKYSGFKISLRWDRPSILWRFPIETVSHSESGLEKTYQGSCIMPSWKLIFQPKEVSKINMGLVLEDIEV